MTMLDFFPDICVGCVYHRLADLGGFMAFLFFFFIFIIVLWEIIRPKK